MSLEDTVGGAHCLYGGRLHYREPIRSKETYAKHAPYRAFCLLEDNTCPYHAQIKIHHYCIANPNKLRIEDEL